jgi:hypothetical protein
MIEIIKTYTGTSTNPYRFTQTVQQMYRCTECGFITPIGKEIKEHECKGKGKHVQNFERGTFASD